jgi:hypothetical protein
VEATHVRNLIESKPKKVRTWQAVRASARAALVIGYAAITATQARRKS